MYPIGIQESIETIFSAIIVGGINNKEIKGRKREVYKQCIPVFLNKFTTNIFKDEYAFLYELIHGLNVKVFTLNQLESVLYNNESVILESPKIDLSKWSNTVDNRPATNDEKIEAFKLNLTELFLELSNKLVTEEEFNSACEIFIDYYSNEEMLNIAQNMSLIMSDLGYIEKEKGTKSKIYKGRDDARRYYNEKIQVLNDFSKETRSYSYIINEDWLEQELMKEASGAVQVLLDFGIKEVDDSLQGLLRGNLLGILGPTKGGKTKMCNFLGGRALDKGLNVAVWALEGTKEEWEANQTALFVRKKYGVVMDSKMILTRNYSTNYLKQLSIAAKTHLALDSSRGRLSFIDKSAYVEDFIDILVEHYENENKYDVVIIDSLVNILSRQNMQKVPRISEAYMKFKDFLVNKLPVPVLGIVPAQLKQKTIDNLRKDPDDDIDITDGAESAETIRTPDEILGMFSSKEERRAGIMKIYGVGSRHTEVFGNFAVRCELGCSYFFSDPELNK